MAKEEWRPVVGYEGAYEVSSLGGVKSIDRYVYQVGNKWGGTTKKLLRGKHLKQSACCGNPGPLKVCLYDDGVGKNMTVHRLVAEAYLGPKPIGKTDCCHNDGNNHNNAAWNLRWDTRAGNLSDMKEHGTVMRGEKNPQALLNNLQAKIIKRVLKNDSSRGVGRFLADVFDIDEKHVSLIKRGVRWGWLEV
jgi:hypothetical protein